MKPSRVLGGILLGLVTIALILFVVPVASIKQAVSTIKSEQIKSKYYKMSVSEQQDVCDEADQMWLNEGHWLWTKNLPWYQDDYEAMKEARVQAKDTNKAHSFIEEHSNLIVIIVISVIVILLAAVLILVAKRSNQSNRVPIPTRPMPVTPPSRATPELRDCTYYDVNYDVLLERYAQRLGTTPQALLDAADGDAQRAVEMARSSMGH